MIKKGFFSLLFTLLALPLLTGSCKQEPQFIEQEQLRAIITEAMLTDAILNQKGYKRDDSVNYYTTILDRAGYTQEDFDHTIKEMASRKSSPLENMFTVIKEDISRAAAAAAYRSEQHRIYDSMALAYSSDTIYMNDTLLKGYTGDFSFVIPSRGEGDYSATFDYLSHGNYSVGMRQVLFNFEDRDTSDTGEKDRKYQSWISRSFKQNKFSYDFTHNSSRHDSLRVTLLDPRNITQDDTSWIRDIVIVHTLEIENARERFLGDGSGLSLDSIYVPKYDFIDEFTIDSLLMGPYIPSRVKP